jgi:hypothetical protein
MFMVISFWGVFVALTDPVPEPLLPDACGSIAVVATQATESL